MPVACLEAAPPSGQTGPALTSQLLGTWPCQEETRRGSEDWCSVGHPPWQAVTSAIAPDAHQAEDLRPLKI